MMGINAALGFILGAGAGFVNRYLSCHVLSYSHQKEDKRGAQYLLVTEEIICHIGNHACHDTDSYSLFHTITGRKYTLLHGSSYSCQENPHITEKSCYSHIYQRGKPFIMGIGQNLLSPQKLHIRLIVTIQITAETIRSYAK